MLCPIRIPLGIFARVVHVRTGNVFSEAAFIDINKWMQACFIDTFYFEEFMAFFFVCLAVAEVFFLTVKR